MLVQEQGADRDLGDRKEMPVICGFLSACASLSFSFIFLSEMLANLAVEDVAYLTDFCDPF